MTPGQFVVIAILLLDGGSEGGTPGSGVDINVLADVYTSYEDCQRAASEVKIRAGLPLDRYRVTCATLVGVPWSAK